MPCSPEAEIAVQAFLAARAGLPGLLRGCVSGQGLIDRGYAEDVEMALRLNASDAAPLLVDGAYMA